MNCRLTLNRKPIPERAPAFDRTDTSWPTMLPAPFEPTGTGSPVPSERRQGLASLAQTTPDLAVLDIELSDGRSLTLAAELSRRGVPVIVFSGYGREDLAAVGLEAEVRFFQEARSPEVQLLAVKRLLAAKHGAKIS